MTSRYAVVMAGGVGSRFWPKSREHMPKQFLKISGDSTMVQNTVQRLLPIVPLENIIVVVNARHASVLKAQVPRLPEENILIEPIGRSTAPCIGLAAYWIQHRDSKASMAVLPSDHIIMKVEDFERALNAAFGEAETNGGLGTIGITPSYPETGFGYIQVAERKNTDETGNPPVYKVKTFAEKPNYETAVRFVNSGEFYWNSGMFVWRVDEILRELGMHLPELNNQLFRVAKVMGKGEYENVLHEAFSLIRSISVDYGVMEKSENVFMVAADIGWSDVGSWDEVFRLALGESGSGNVKTGDAFVKDSNRVFVDSGGKFVAVIGIDDIIVVNTEDATLICKKGRSQEVKEIVDYLRRKDLSKLL